MEQNISTITTFKEWHLFSIAYSQPHIRCIEPNYKEYLIRLYLKNESKIIKGLSYRQNKPLQNQELKN